MALHDINDYPPVALQVGTPGPKTALRFCLAHHGFTVHTARSSACPDDAYALVLELMQITRKVAASVVKVPT